MGSLDALVKSLSPEQRAALARIQRDPRTAAALTHEARVKSAAATPARVEAFARAEGPELVRLHAKGLRLINGANAREHHFARAARFAAEHRLIGAALAPVSRPVGPAYRVTITREGRALMDTDGLAISAKGVRDSIAAWLGVDDGPEGPVVWSYAQHKTKGYGVMVTIEGVRDGAP
jgi:hypothetical protein